MQLKVPLPWWLPWHFGTDRLQWSSARSSFQVLPARQVQQGWCRVNQQETRFGPQIFSSERHFWGQRCSTDSHALYASIQMTRLANSAWKLHFCEYHSHYAPAHKPSAYQSALQNIFLVGYLEIPSDWAIQWALEFWPLRNVPKPWNHPGKHQ